jgi:rhodanese-related sulfurtransferase
MSGQSGKSSKTRPPGASASGRKKTGPSAGTAGKKGAPASPKLSATWLAVGSGVVALILIVALGVPFLSGQKSAGAAASPAGGTTATSVQGNVIQGNGGHWTNISPDTLASMLDHKDFTFLNVKTPYIGEIDRTDLYIPYTALAARAGELPADKAAPIVVYCRSGNESGIASQTLLDLGYTNIYNLDGGMNAWTASGRQIVNKNRS